MKARIPVTNAQKRLIREEARREYEKVREKECEDITRRLLKVMCESLHDVFGFGNGRLMVTLNDITRRLEHMAEIRKPHMDGYQPFRYTSSAFLPR